MKQFHGKKQLGEFLKHDYKIHGDHQFMTSVLDMPPLKMSVAGVRVRKIGPSQALDADEQ